MGTDGEITARLRRIEFAQGLPILDEARAYYDTCFPGKMPRPHFSHFLGWLIHEGIHADKTDEAPKEKSRRRRAR